MSYTINPFLGKLDKVGAGSSSFPASGGTFTGDVIFNNPTGKAIQGKADTSDGVASLDLPNAEGQSDGESGSFNAGTGQQANGSGGSFSVNGGNANAEGDGNGGDVELNGGEASGSGTGGKVKIASSGGWQVALDTDSLSANRNISFPDKDGVLATVADIGASNVPEGGTTDQVLAKNSNTDFDTKWVDQTGGSSLPTQTGNASKFLMTDGSDTSWQYTPYDVDGGAFSDTYISTNPIDGGAFL